MAEAAPQPCVDSSNRFVQLVERTAMTLIERELGCEAALTDRLVPSLETRLPHARPCEVAQPSRPGDDRSPTPETREESP